MLSQIFTPCVGAIPFIACKAHEGLDTDWRIAAIGGASGAILCWGRDNGNTISSLISVVTEF